MKRLFNYIPSICLCFTLGVILIAFTNLTSSYASMSNIGILLYFILVILAHTITFAVSNINFKTYKAYHISNFLALYLFSLIASYFFNFFSFSIKNLVFHLMLSILMYFLIYQYYDKKSKLEADEINKKISKS